MKIKFLKAYNGDSILISLQDTDGSDKNILIDGGIKKTYKTDKGSKGKPEFGELKIIIDTIRNNNKFIDLLIITHIDEDHIGGIIKWFNDDENAFKLIKEVWFNSGKGIATFLKQSENKDLEHLINSDKTTLTSIDQGIDFSEYITEKGILFTDIILQANELRRFGYDFKILSPNKTKLELLLKEWKIKEPNLNTASKPNDYAKTIKEHLANDIFLEDNAYPNGSSIAFILKKEEDNFLFLGDSHPSVIVEGLNNFNYCEDNKLIAKFVKVSHHGSKGNTSIELLKCINSKNFMVSTNGSGDQHPHKQLLSRLIKEKEDCNIYFNYKERMEMIFTEQDKLDYPNFNPIAITNEFEF
ncbi:ComEC/Rec2 family competence protein [Flavobacterium sp. Arc2]|jgi:beta-lactamase superfamily II metal-dependent hydrolase|uniref:ComEC/Rec2 family competence protein n=1 Tax=Flavobacterium sp. Arc2 TaxID=3046685 RepID=UPI00352F9634